MHTTTPQRKIKARLRTIIFIVSLFFATLSICAILFAVFTTQALKLISPITVQQQAINDAGIAIVKDLCQKDGLPCENVINLTDGSVQITLTNGGIAILSAKKDFKNQLASLQQALSQLTIKGKQFKKLDFRFANTVATF